eukprot:1161960-Pelagomonas_calceolata.AAC.8
MSAGADWCQDVMSRLATRKTHPSCLKGRALFQGKHPGKRTSSSTCVRGSGCNFVGADRFLRERTPSCRSGSACFCNRGRILRRHDRPLGAKASFAAVHPERPSYLRIGRPLGAKQYGHPENTQGCVESCSDCKLPGGLKPSNYPGMGPLQQQAHPNHFQHPMAPIGANGSIAAASPSKPFSTFNSDMAGPQVQQHYSYTSGNCRKMPGCWPLKNPASGSSSQQIAHHWGAVVGQWSLSKIGHRVCEEVRGDVANTEGPARHQRRQKHTSVLARHNGGACTARQGNNGGACKVPKAPEEHKAFSVHK